MQMTSRRMLSRMVLAIVIGPFFSDASYSDDHIRVIGDGGGGFAPAVVVSDAELIHTTQLFPISQDSELIGGGDPATQIDRVMNDLVNVLAACDARPEDIVKLNVYLADESASEATLTSLKRQFGEHSRPAVTFVTTKLPVEGALIAVDAVAARTPQADSNQVERRHVDTSGGRDKLAHVSVVPQGDVIFISGQAEPADNLEEATQKTLAGLARTLEHLDLDLDDVAQVKCFLQPMSDADAAYRAAEEFFGDQLVPPISCVEWISSYPNEIEMVVHAPATESSETVDYAWLPWLSESPVYCRLTRVRGGTLIYTSGFFGDMRSNESEQVADVFGQLQRTLELGGSDLRHMAKATYYVSNEEASGRVNEIRPTLYDPQRPPAASKALVYGVGFPGRHVTIDMIAAPTAGE
ncbi:MAG: hypothetical protein DWQ29_02645 [Planctomycetota bacterium]|nr:MAG: hypothetical protein DWQ29_02645 [Planctomycetota bacterium]